MAVGQRSWVGMDANGERDGFMVTDPDSMGDGGTGGAAGDLNPNQLQVANERGDALGDFVQAPSFTLNEAHQRFVASRDTGSVTASVDMRQLLEQTLREIRQKESQDTSPSRHKSRKRKRQRPDQGAKLSKRKRTDTARQALHRVFDLQDDPSDSSSDSSRSESEDSERAAEDMSNMGEWDLGGLAVAYDLAKSDTESTSEEGWELKKLSREDRQYVEERFGKHLKRAQVPLEDFVQHACPLCTFLDNQHDAIGDLELQKIEYFITNGMGNISEYDHANLIAIMWNKNIYEPMKREKKRIFKLTASMALAHITKPHRITKPALKLRDTRKLLMAEECFWASTFSQNPMTQEPKVNRWNAQLALKSMELRWKILGVDDKKDPFPSASHQVNPTKATRRIRKKQ